MKCSARFHDLPSFPAYILPVFVCVFFVTSFCLSLRILALDFNSDFHEKFVSPGIEHAKNTAAIPHGSRFHQIIVYIFCFCFNNSLEQKPVATKYDSFLFFFFSHFLFSFPRYSQLQLCFAFVLSLVHLISFFFCFFFFVGVFSHWFSQKRTVNCSSFWFLLFCASNYWLHNGPVKIKAKRQQQHQPNIIMRKRSVFPRKGVHDFNIER